MKHCGWLRIRVQRLFPTSAACAAPAGRGRRRLCFAASGVLLLPLAALAQDAEVIYQIRSQYQFITVQDTANGYRQLIFDGRFDGTDAIQSEMNLASPDDLTLSYSQHIMAALPVVSRPRRILVVGLGGACIQRYLRRLLPDATIETAELDPVMKDVAAKYFFFREDARQMVRLGDGRALVESSKDRYDIIFLDAFSARSIPYHLTTREFLQAVKDHLADGGVVAANLWDGEASYWDQVRTYAAVFPEWHVVKCAGSGNSIVLAVPAKMGLTVQAWADKAAAFEKARPTGLDLPRLILRGAAAETSIPESARVLADNAKTEGSGGIWAVPLPEIPSARKELPDGAVHLM